jgi:hypothetical protein
MTGVHSVVGTTLFTSGTFGVVGTTLFTSGAFGVVGTATFTGAFNLGSQVTGLLISSGTGAITATTNFPIGFTFNTFSVGNIGTTTFTAVPSNGNYQRYFNNAAHTVSSFTTSDHAIDVLVTNTTGAGSITFTGFTVNTSNIGDALTTTNGNQFIIAMRRMGGTATYVIKALQ